MSGEEETTFTLISESDNDEDWPDGVRTLVFAVEGRLADRIRRAAGESPRAPVVMTEVRTDGGYSEWTQETDFEFTLRVGGTTIELGESFYDHNNSIRGLSKWLEEHGEAEL